MTTTMARAHRVLLVEDDPGVRELLLEILLLHGFETRGLPTGGEGLREARDWRPDALVLDVMLPDMDGFQVCRSLRADPETTQLPVVILTSLQESSGRQRAFAAGADRFVAKPFDPDELVDELRGLVAPDRGELRHESRLPLRDSQDLSRRLGELASALHRVTPLELPAIRELQRSLEELGRAGTWHPAPERVGSQVVCRVYADRIELRVPLEQTFGEGAWGVVGAQVHQILRPGSPTQAEGAPSDGVIVSHRFLVT